VKRTALIALAGGTSDLNHSKLPDKLPDKFLAKITGAAPAAGGKKTFKTTEW
jgi:hypothetical protein